ncbi:MAG: VCBS repeat-containing protein [candidate division Zixibacteria bacterium]|nr:VCBS repeat-containing protein [candidate division Zixibacteria bacterium]
MRLHCLALMVGLILVSATAFAATPLMGIMKEYEGSSLRSAASADFNGDGYSDLAVAKGNGIYILFNEGMVDEVVKGDFGSRTEYNTVSNVTSIVAANFGGDSLPDLAMTNDMDSLICILINKGDGTFNPPVCYKVGANPNFLAAGYFNDDTLPDLAVARNDSISILLNNGGRGFYLPVPSAYEVPGGPSSIAVADFDGNGIHDLAVTSIEHDSVLIFLNNGDGWFGYGPAGTHPVGDQPVFVFSADFDGDGDNDLAVANENSGSVSILLNYYYGNFANSVNYEVGNMPMSVYAEDFDEDGDNDLAVATAASSSRCVTILRNQGNGIFAEPYCYLTGGAPDKLIATDFDYDDDHDLVILNGNPGGCLVTFENLTTRNCGDVNHTETVNLQDVTYLINYLYKGGPAPIPLEAGNVNNSDPIVINIQDIGRLINHLYMDGSELNCPK